ncbi:MAG: cation:proton antiporter [Burkholderiales bacterium]
MTPTAALSPALGSPSLAPLAGSAPLWTLEGWRGADPVMGIALLMVIALLAGEAVYRLTRLPRAIGPMLVGVLASPLALNLVEVRELNPWKPLLDLAVGMLVFELGTRIRPRWLIDNPWLALQSLFEAALSGAAVAAALVALGAPRLSAALAGFVAMSTSPVIALATVHELRTRGQVTERLLMLATLNSVLAVLALKVWSVLALTGAPGGAALASLGGAVYALCGSFLLGAFTGLLLERLSSAIAGSTARAILQLAMLVLATMLAAQLRLSPLLALLVAGMVARARMGHALQVAPQFGLAGATLTLLLFLSFGLLTPRLQGLGLWAWMAAIIAARMAGKTIAVLALARPSGLSWRQAAGLAVALQPASGLAVLMVSAGFDWSGDLPTPDAPVLQALLGAVALMQLLGPAFAQWGLQTLAGEGRSAGPRAGPPSFMATSPDDAASRR